jgi:transcriptional regulator with XRE-family HTH domain
MLCGIEPRRRFMTNSLPPVTAPQSRAGRALIGWSVAALAEASGLSAAEIEQFEADAEDLDPGCQRAIRSALEDAGVTFIPELGGAGFGVQLKFPRQTVKRIQTWEGEGGATGEDDIA